MWGPSRDRQSFDKYMYTYPQYVDLWEKILSLPLYPSYSDVTQDTRLFRVGGKLEREDRAMCPFNTGL